MATEDKKKNELGNIYGSRLSKNKKWLNLLIVTHIDGKEVKITCPVRIDETQDKPFALIKEFEDADNEQVKRASVLNIKVYEDKKPTEEQATAESVDLPF